MSDIKISVTDAHLIRPGDYLVLITEGTLARSQAEVIKETVKRECPLLAGVIVTGAGWRMITFRPEASDE